MFGVLESVVGGGAVLGALVADPLAPARAAADRAAADARLAGAGLAFALGAPLAVVVVFALAAGFGFALFGVWWETALARHIPAARAVAGERL